MVSSSKYMTLPSANGQNKTMMNSKGMIHQILKLLSSVTLDFLHLLLNAHYFHASTRTYAGKSLYCRNFKKNHQILLSSFHQLTEQRLFTRKFLSFYHFCQFKAELENVALPFCHLECSGSGVERSGYLTPIGFVYQISPLRALCGPPVEMTGSHFKPIDAACYPTGCG